MTDKETTELDDELYQLVYKYIPKEYELINSKGGNYWGIRDSLINLINDIRLTN